MKIKSQAGFSLIEGLLIVIAITLIAFVGFYVYNANRNTDKTVSKATNSQSTPSKKAATANTEYLTIKELGIKVPLDSSLRGLDYSIAPTDNTIAGLSTKGFEQAVSECKSADTAASSFPAIGSVTKVSGTYDSSQPPQDYFSEFAKQFPGFYLTYGAPDGGPSLFCNDNNQTRDDKVKNMFNQLSPAIKEAVKHAQEL